MRIWSDDFEKTVNKALRGVFGAIAVMSFAGIVIGAWWQIVIFVISIVAYITIGKDGRNDK